MTPQRLRTHAGEARLPLTLHRVAISYCPVGGIQSSAQWGSERSKGEPGPSLIYFSINTQCICWGVAWTRAAICPLARWGGGRGEPGSAFFTQAVMQQDCLPVRMPVPHYQTLPLIALLQSRCLAHIWIYSQKEAHVSFWSSQESAFIRVCYLTH